MATKRTLGGQRINSGNKMQVEMHGYGRATFNKSKKVMLTAAPGVLYPVWKELILPEDTWDIGLSMEAITKATVGPLFDSYEIEMHVFEAPWRLYNGDVHNNEVGIGNDMSQIKLPTISLKAQGKGGVKTYSPTDQINPSALPAFLGIPGIGRQSYNNSVPQIISRDFNAIPFLAYYEIFKCYFANQQEPEAWVIHTAPISSGRITNVGVTVGAGIGNIAPDGTTPQPIIVGITRLIVTLSTAQDASVYPAILASLAIETKNEGPVRANYLFAPSVQTGVSATITTGFAIRTNTNAQSWKEDTSNLGTEPQLQKFTLSNIDLARKLIMRNTGLAGAWNMNTAMPAVLPYANLYTTASGSGTQASKYAIQYAQEGLVVGTYKSDINNNWLSATTVLSVNQKTTISTTTGGFTIDTLNIQQKIYNYLNRIVLSGGTYNDWLEVSWDSNRLMQCETPMYHGGLIKEIAFQEVVSTAAAPDGIGSVQPLGQQAGKGVLTNKHKGGKMTIHVREPGYLMAILKITPKICYSQGIDFDMNLKTFDDLHKPAFDGIGFQDLIAETMDWRATGIDGDDFSLLKTTIGKQPAWIAYQTAVNTSYGSFAEPSEMFMTLNRQYEENTINGAIKDATSYIDPKKYNNVFADTAITAMNFWIQLGIHATVRRKQSANNIPQM